MPSIAKKRQIGRARRHFRARKKIQGTPMRPRLAVFRSNKHIVAQVIDDSTGRTLASASSLDKSLPAGPKGNVATSTAVGTMVAERAKAAGIERVVFDRGGYIYHGRIAAVAEAARAAGLEF